jgi:predicted transcriptional regulator
MTKEKLLELAAGMPDQFHVDEVIERLLFIADVEEGMQKIRDGNGIPHEEVEKMIDEWRK